MSQRPSRKDVQSPDWVCPSTIMIHFKPRSKRVFILGTVKPAHLINYIIPAMASTRCKPFLIVLGLTCTQARDVCSQRRPPSSSCYVIGGPGPLALRVAEAACNHWHPHYSVYPMIRPTRLGASILHFIYLLPLSRKWQLEIQ